MFRHKHSNPRFLLLSRRVPVRFSLAPEEKHSVHSKRKAFWMLLKVSCQLVLWNGSDFLRCTIKYGQVPGYGDGYQAQISKNAQCITANGLTEHASTYFTRKSCASDDSRESWGWRWYCWFSWLRIWLNLRKRANSRCFNTDAILSKRTGYSSWYRQSSTFNFPSNKPHDSQASEQA